MRQLVGMIRKEFIQVFRDRNMIQIIFLVPIVQLFLFGYVVNLEVREIRVDAYDLDRSVLSREFVRNLEAGDYFIVHEPSEPLLSLEANFENSSREMAVIIPDDFSEKIESGSDVTIGLVADGSNANTTAIGSGYLARIVHEFSLNLAGRTPPVEVRMDILYNPEEESVNFMIPGIVATLLTMVTVMLTSMAIVREREGGTLEQLMVTPMSGNTILLGKLIPFGLLGMFEMIVALTFGVLWFGIPFVGSPLLLFALAGLFLVSTLGIGLFFSTVTSTQQQAMFFAWFFSVFAILTSGFFTPIANMPEWLQYITYANPMRYFMTATREIMMKGAGISDLMPQIGAMATYGVIIFTVAATRFSKRVA